MLHTTSEVCCSYTWMGWTSQPPRQGGSARTHSPHHSERGNRGGEVETVWCAAPQQPGRLIAIHDDVAAAGAGLWQKQLQEFFPLCRGWGLFTPTDTFLLSFPCWPQYPWGRPWSPLTRAHVPVPLTVPWGGAGGGITFSAGTSSHARIMPGFWFSNFLSPLWGFLL